jgi:hypothetical protein
MGLPGLAAQVFGATMVLRGIPDFTRIPPSSRLQDEDSGTTLTVDMENRPCHLVSKEIEARIRVSARRSNRRPRGGAA